MRPCPHGIVSGQCQWCLAEALEHERQILARLRAASLEAATASQEPSVPVVTRPIEAARKEGETLGRED